MNAPNSASLGAMGSLLRKLGELCTIQDKALSQSVQHLRDGLASICSSLEKLSEVNDPSLTASYWMKDARDLSYETEDFLDQCFFLHDDNLDAEKRFMDEISGFQARVEEVADRYSRYKIEFILSRATNIVTAIHHFRIVYQSMDPFVPIGMENLTNGLVEWIKPKDADNQLKAASIHGVQGVGKTTLAQKLWNDESGENFDCRASVQAAKRPDMRMILTRILSQVLLTQKPEAHDVQNLIQDLRRHLQDKRYFIIIDDLWSVSVWDVISCAFPDGNRCSRVLTTTTSEDIALACCSYEPEHVFQMNPLGDDHSKQLFVDRVFGTGNRCPPQFKDVTEEITRKCGGLPLAIICVASHIASQPETEYQWEGVQNYLRHNLSTNPTSVEILKQAFNLCYNTLPQYLKTCLLYLSVYPENYLILKDDLLKQWIAEGFICTRKEENIVEVANSYLNQLVSLGLIQRMDINCNKKSVFYVVHPMLLDFITCKSTEDNFITIIDYSQSTVVTSDIIRRLSLHFGSATYASIPESILLSQVRSLTFMGLLNCMPSLVEFKLLRVIILHLRGDNGDTNCSLTGIRGMLLLRYLQIKCNITVELPVQMGCLKQLETFEINSRFSVVPMDIFHLSRLMHVRLGRKANLTQGPDLSVKAISSCDYSNVPSPPVFLQRFELLPPICIFSRIPVWVRQLHKLSILEIMVREVRMNDIDIVSELPALKSLSLNVRTPTQENIVFREGAFPALEYFKFVCGVLLLVFQEKAMPNLRKLKVGFNARRGGQYGDMLVGIENLLNLEEINGRVGAAAGVEESDRNAAESAFKGGISTHACHRSSKVKMVDPFVEEYDPSDKKNWSQQKESLIERDQVPNKGELMEEEEIPAKSTKKHSDVRYKLDDSTPAKTSCVDSRIASLYPKVADVGGIDEAREELISWLSKGDDDIAAAEQRIVSVVGFGGLGKTTLAKAVFDKLKGQFDCTAFIPVGRNPDLKKVLKDILIDLHKQGYKHFNLDILDERQLIVELREFLEKKRYFIVIDDVWEAQTWETIKLSLVDNNIGSRIIITTSKHEVAREAGEVYTLQPLSDDNSRKLFLPSSQCEFATGALGTLLRKLGQLLKDEYNLQKGIKKNIEFLARELESMRASLCSVGEVPPEQLDKHVRIWARDVRELSYDMEDIVDTFLVRVKDPEPPSKKSAKSFMKKMMGIVTNAGTRHEIAQEIKDIKERVKEVAERCERYKVDAISPAKTMIDPRITSLYIKAADLVGIDESREELITTLTKGDDPSAQQKIVSVVGFGGLGKTTLAKAVYDKLKGQFDCTAFVPVGRHPVLKNVLKDILIDLHKGRMHLNLNILDERQLIGELQEFLEKKRYFIVIDDVWEAKTWETIKLALVEKNVGSRIITTTRKQEVAREAGEVYELQPLSYDNSRKLFFARIFGSESKSSEQQSDDVSDKILRKCGGIPLVIITMASLLVGKPREEWSEVHRFVGYSSKGNQQVENTMKILSFSYYDLPPHLRTCLLHLSVFPEDSFIEKGPLIWMWIAEGFVPQKQGRSSFEIGEGYFNELVNRSMIQLVEKFGEYPEMLVCGCQVHYVVLDLIRYILSEDNFVTILQDKNNEAAASSAEAATTQQGRVRRLALQNINKTVVANMDMQQVRSFVLCGCDSYDGIVPFVSRLELVRVLSIDTSKRRMAVQKFFEPKTAREAPTVAVQKLVHLRYLRLSRDVVLPEEIGTLKFLQALDVHEPLTTVGSLSQLLCLRIRGMVSRVPDGIGKLTSLQELQMIYRVQEDEPLRQFVKELGALRELRVLRLMILRESLEYGRGVIMDLVESLRNLQRMDHLSLLNQGLKQVYGDTATLEAWGFLLPRTMRQLSLDWIKFSRFPSFCINPSRLPHLSHLYLYVDYLDEQAMRVLAGLPQLCDLQLHVGTVEVVCNTTSTDDTATGDDCFFPKLRCCSLQCGKVLFQAKGDSGVVLFSMHSVNASMLLGSGRTKDVCSGNAATLMPRIQRLEFVADAQQWIKDGGDCVSLVLQHFASLQNIVVSTVTEDEDGIQVDEEAATAMAAALQHAADVHPNCPKLEIKRIRVLE